eukprot:GHVT01095523.1.p1 GENE.GHVT01095523.1~~GHVT01095523.1.p1  ORF type:complete len:514 (-),score=68.96 GHVT01095523.1:2562-4103(-)
MMAQYLLRCDDSNDMSIGSRHLAEPSVGPSKAHTTASLGQAVLACNPSGQILDPVRAAWDSAGGRSPVTMPWGSPLSLPGVPLAMPSALNQSDIWLVDDACGDGRSLLSSPLSATSSTASTAASGASPNISPAACCFRFNAEPPAAWALQETFAQNSNSHHKTIAPPTLSLEDESGFSCLGHNGIVDPPNLWVGSPMTASPAIAPAVDIEALTPLFQFPHNDCMGQQKAFALPHTLGDATSHHQSEDAAPAANDRGSLKPISWPLHLQHASHHSDQNETGKRAHPPQNSERMREATCFDKPSAWSFLKQAQLHTTDSSPPPPRHPIGAPHLYSATSWDPKESPNVCESLFADGVARPTFPGCDEVKSNKTTAGAYGWPGLRNGEAATNTEFSRCVGGRSGRRAAPNGRSAGVTFSPLEQIYRTGRRSNGRAGKRKNDLSNEGSPCQSDDQAGQNEPRIRRRRKKIKQKGLVGGLTKSEYLHLIKVAILTLMAPNGVSAKVHAPNERKSDTRIA